MPKKDLTNIRFGRLVVISDTGKIKHGKVIWNCICDCGKNHTVMSSYLLNGTTSSCGCKGRREFLDGMKEDIKYEKKAGESGFRSLLSNYKKDANAKNKPFEIPEEEFIKIVKENCYICGKNPAQKISSGSSRSCFTYNGIDRIDNTVGYKKDNCNSCCRRCNIAKKDMSLNEFKDFITKAYESIVVKGCLIAATTTSKRMKTKKDEEKLTGIIG